MLMEVMEGEDNEKRCQNQGLESKQTLGLLGKKKWAEGFQNYQIS